VTLRLYDLAGAEEERRFSPYCWRVRMALAHKELPVETVPWRFTEKEAIAASGQTRVPVLVDGDRWIADSWNIACWLEDRYPDGPSLFGGAAGRALSRLISHWSDTALVGGMFPLVAADVWVHVHEKDRAYFRKSREERLGATLEASLEQRTSRLPLFQRSLAPLRATLELQPYLGGDTPLYADYAAFGPFQWARCISPLALLAPDDPVARWRERMLAAFGGLARAAPGYEP
jgi:glutathione S-transferase